MTEGRTISAGIAVLFFLLCPALNAQAGSLGALIAQQEGALRTLEQAMSGRNPYLQWRTAQEAVETVRQTSGNLAEESTKIEQQLGELVGRNQQLVLAREALIKEVQGLKISNQNLTKANANLNSEKQQLLVQHEQFEAMQSFFSMAFYASLTLALLGFGGLLIRIPTTRLDRRLTRLEITNLENKLRKEALSSQAEEARPRQVKRPMAERKAVEMKTPKEQHGDTESVPVKANPRDAQEATSDERPIEALGKKAKRRKAQFATAASNSGKSKNVSKKGQTKPKQKEKKKTKKKQSPTAMTG